MKGKIKLICGDESQSFPFEQAQSLLYIQKEMNRTLRKKIKGWELPEDSPYEFINNGLIKRPNKGNSKIEAVSKGDSKRDKAPE